MNLDIGILEQALQRVQDVVEKSKVVFYYPSEFVPRYGSDGKEVVYKLPLAGDGPDCVVLLHSDLVAAFCEKAEREGLTAQLMDWDERSKMQHACFMERLCDELDARQAREEVAYEWKVGAFGLPCWKGKGK